MDAVIYVRDLLAGLRVPWFLCGGWAADAWLGRQTRDHADVDIAVPHDDQRALFDHLPGWALVAHDPNVPDDTTEQWDGRHLDRPAHIHVPTARSPLATSRTLTHSEHDFEFLLSERSADDLMRHSTLSPLGLRVLSPELVLLYKAADLRPQDEADFTAVLPTLSEAQRRWLCDRLVTAHPGHPWPARCCG